MTAIAPPTPLSRMTGGIDACVHCGFCLQSCPTYLTLEDENDSPRGRIVLMRSLIENTLPLDDEDVRTHIDRCLGCRACETACPSGVPYGQLLEATRETLTQRRRNPFVARLILFVFARKPLMQLAMLGGRVTRLLRVSRLLSALPGRLGFAMAMLESTRRADLRASRSRTAELSSGPTLHSATILEGCVMQGLFSDTNRATERTLSRNGYTMLHTPEQGCCGALHAHAGDAETARALARRNIAAFEKSNADYVAVNAAGCGAQMKEYSHLLSHDREWHERAVKFSSRVRDVSELLAVAGPVKGSQLDVSVTYDAPCHLLHAQRVSAPPLAVLAAIPGLTLVPLTGSEHCCGSAGIYNLIEPMTSNKVLDVKLKNIAASKAAFVATGNPGCMMQIGAGLLRARIPARTIHPADLLDASYGAQ